VAIRNAIYADDPITVGEFVSWGEQSHELFDRVAHDDGRVVGAARAFLEPPRPNPWAHVWVASDRRRRGAGSALFAEVSRWAAESRHSSFEAWVSENEPDGLAFAQARGFEETGRERILALDLTTSTPPEVEPPAGIEILTWAERLDLARAIYEVAAEAIPDVPGEGGGEVRSFEDWLEGDMQSSGDKPEATFVALAGDEVVGYSKFSLSEAQQTVAHHDMTGVKRAWRGRGIARALKARQIRWAKEHGYQQLRTRNEDRNVPIRRLNEEFGYVPVSGRIYLRGPVG
jgi:GNAT superfamily N-acetyltransferase